MKIGDSVYTPRFCTVRISAIFATEAEAHAAGFREPTYYKGDDCKERNGDAWEAYQDGYGTACFPRIEILTDSLHCEGGG